MNDTLNGLVTAHNNHNLVLGVQATIGGGSVAAGSEYVKHVDVQQVSWLTSHAIGLLTVGDCLSLIASAYVLTGIWRFYIDMKDRYNEKRSQAERRKNPTIESGE